MNKIWVIWLFHNKIGICYYSISYSILFYKDQSQVSTLGYSVYSLSGSCSTVFRNCGRILLSFPAPQASFLLHWKTWWKGRTCNCNNCKRQFQRRMHRNNTMNMKKHDKYDSQYDYEIYVLMIADVSWCHTLLDQHTVLNVTYKQNTKCCLTILSVRADSLHCFHLHRFLCFLAVPRLDLGAEIMCMSIDGILCSWETFHLQPTSEEPCKELLSEHIVAVHISYLDLFFKT